MSHEEIPKKIDELHKEAQVQIQKKKKVIKMIFDYFVQSKFNNNINSRGKKGSLMRVCAEVLSKVKKVFINSKNDLYVTFKFSFWGTNSSCEGLSYYHRPKERSNQSMEGSNKNLNDIDRLIEDFSKNSFERWLRFAQIVERLSINRLGEIKLGAPYKTKSSSCIKKDKIVAVSR